MSLSVETFNQYIENIKTDNFNFQKLTQEEFDAIYTHKKESRAREIIQLKSNNYKIEYLGDLFWEWNRKEYYKNKLKSGR